LDPTDRQLLALMLKSKGFKTSEIAELLNTTKQNVASLIKRGMRNINKYEVLYKVMKACWAKGFLDLPEGLNLYQASVQIIDLANELSIKLKGNVNDIMSFLKIEGSVKEGVLTEPHGVALMDDGSLVVLKGESLAKYNNLVSVYRAIINKRVKGTQ